MKDSILLIFTCTALAVGVGQAMVAAPPPVDVRTHPTDPPDNRLTPPAETMSPPQPVDSERPRTAASSGFDMLDSNQDGLLSRVEFSVNNAPVGDFDRFDTNRDGNLSKDEWQRSQTPSPHGKGKR